MSGKERRKVDLVLVAALVLLTASVFHEALRAGFINLDDPDYVTDNPRVAAGITLEGIRWAFTTTHASNWHPLTWISHMLDSTLFGLDPAGHHLVSLILHLANTLLVYFLWRTMTGQRGRSFLLAAFFAVHPLHVESVVWVSERKDVLSTFFALLTMGSYLAYLRHRTRPWQAAMFGLFALALLAKPMPVTLPLTFLLLDFWPLGRFVRRDQRIGAGIGHRASWSLVTEKWPLLLLALASGLVTIVAQRSGGALMTLVTSPLHLRLENALVSYVAYLGRTLLPTGLSVFYPYRIGTIPPGMYLGAAALLIALTWVVWRLRSTRPYFIVGWLWYLVTLLPVIGLIQVGQQSMADRYTYIPIIGVFLAIIWRAGDAQPAMPWLKAGIAAVCILLLAYSSSQRVGDWHDSGRLFRSALVANANNWLAHENLAVALVMVEGNAAVAIGHYQESLRLLPGRSKTYNSMGKALGSLGRVQESIRAYREAVRLNPGNAEAWFNLGMAHLWSGDVAAASEVLQRLQPVDRDLAARLQSYGAAPGPGAPRR